MKDTRLIYVFFAYTTRIIGWCRNEICLMYVYYRRNFVVPSFVRLALRFLPSREYLAKLVAAQDTHMAGTLLRLLYL